jgi:hypothetical protein
MRRRMSRRSNIAHAASDFAALPDELGPVGDRRQVLSSCSNGARLEWLGKRRTVDLAFEAAAGPVIPLRTDEDELSLWKPQCARFRHQAADMVQVTLRDHDQIYALWRDSGLAQVRLEPGKAAERWADFLAEAGVDKDTLPSRVDHQQVVRCLDFTGCVKFAFNTGATSASEAFMTKIVLTGIGPWPSETTAAWTSPILKR